MMEQLIRSIVLAFFIFGVIYVPVRVAYLLWYGRFRWSDFIIFGVMTMILFALAPWFSLQNCVVEGTLIDTPEGRRPIEFIKSGDSVLTLTLNGQTEIGRVTEITSHTALHYLQLTFDDGNQLSVTPAHPVATRNGWQLAELLDLTLRNRLLNDRERVADAPWRKCVDTSALYYRRSGRHRSCHTINAKCNAMTPLMSRKLCVHRFAPNLEWLRQEGGIAAFPR